MEATHSILFESTILIQIILQLAAAAGMAQLPQSFGLDLADTLSSYIKFLADLFQGMGLSVGEAEAHPQDLLFPAGQGFERRPAPEFRLHSS